MSMNVYICAEREIFYFDKHGQRKTDKQYTKFPAIQTRTAETYQICGSADPKQAYIDHVKTLSHVEKQAIYAKDDIWQEGEPIGYEEYDWTVEHLESFEKWYKEVDEEGYVIKFEVI